MPKTLIYFYSIIIRDRQFLLQPIITQYGIIIILIIIIIVIITHICLTSALTYTMLQVQVKLNYILCTKLKQTYCCIVIIHVKNLFIFFVNKRYFVYIIQFYYFLRHQHILTTQLAVNLLCKYFIVLNVIQFAICW